MSKLPAWTKVAVVERNGHPNVSWTTTNHNSGEHLYHGMSYLLDEEDQNPDWHRYATSSSNIIFVKIFLKKIYLRVQYCSVLFTVKFLPLTGKVSLCYNSKVYICRQA